jgi:hypothetical protein
MPGVRPLAHRYFFGAALSEEMGKKKWLSPQDSPDPHLKREGHSAHVETVDDAERTTEPLGRATVKCVHIEEQRRGWG